MMVGERPFADRRRHRTGASAATCLARATYGQQRANREIGPRGLDIGYHGMTRVPHVWHQSPPQCHREAA